MCVLPAALQLTVLGSAPVHTMLIYSFPALLLGNLVDILFQIRFKFGGSVLVYLSDHW